MERIILSLLIIFLMPVATFAMSVPLEIDEAFKTQNQQQVIDLISPRNIDFKDCTKKFNINSENLYYLTLASINANKFEINEFQTKCGYILFTVSKKQYLAQVSKTNKDSSILRITPCDNNYYFPLGILTNTFKYIDLNVETLIEKMN